MPANKPKVGSDEWYRDTLYAALMARNKATAIYDRYYRGDHRLAFATNKFREAFGSLFAAFADNWCDLVVDAVEERIDVEGFRFGDQPGADHDAWNIWQRNQMDALSQQGHLESLIYGTASVLVWNDTAGDAAEITMEHPTQMIVATDPARVTRRIAALKVWAGDDSTNMATLYTPNRIVKWTAKGSKSGAKPAWESRGDTIEHDLGVVPVVQLPNRPRLLRPGRSEIAGVIPVQDAVNKLIADMMVASEFQAFHQRWATGLEIPTIFDDDGNPLPADEALKKTWKHAEDRLLWTTDPDTKFGEFNATDLAPFVTAVEMLVQHVASQTRTPPHYFYLSGQFPSGEALAIDTPIATPEGFRPIGDLEAGDAVFDPDGIEQSVIHAFAPLYDRPCYRVVFDDGVAIVADAGHRWMTSHYPTRSAARRVTGAVTTRELAESLTVPRGKKRAQAHHWIPLAQAPDFPSGPLPIDPYVLGCWLGDGSRGHGCMTCHIDDAEHFVAEWEAAGEGAYAYQPSPHRPTIRRVHAGRNTDGAYLRGRLNALGILHDKRIPDMYLASSAKDRLALLQGLMDTDGTVNRRQGSVSFSQSNRAVAEDVLRLIQSLGHKAALRGNLDDRHGFRISWSALDPVFRLARKADLQRMDWPDGGAGNRVRGRYIVAVESVDSVPVRCIEVTGSSHLFTAGPGLVATHNSIKSAETGLVAKVLRKERFYGEAWEEVIRLAFGVEGDDRKAADYTAEVIWADPESRTESEHVDAVMKKAALGIPMEQIYEDLGYSQTTIRRFEAMRAREQARTLTLATALASSLDEAGPAPEAQPPANPEV